MIDLSAYQILSLTGVPALVGIFFAILIKRPLEKRVATAEAAQATQKTQSAAIMLGVQALLRDRLLQAYHFYNRQGWVGYEDRRNIENIYVQYEALGPNSVMDKLHENFTKLPDEPPVQ